MLALSPDVIHEELQGVQKLINKWTGIVNNGIPGVDTPASEEAAEKFLRQLVGELLFVAGRCQNMALILAER